VVSELVQEPEPLLELVLKLVSALLEKLE